MQVVLVMFRADGERRSFSLPRQVTVIGRREDCDLRIPLGDVSRKHCRFIIEDDTLRVEDLGSSNGTYHNGVRIQEAVVQAGDTVQVGPVAFVVQINGVPADDEIQPTRQPAAAADDTSMGGAGYAAGAAGGAAMAAGDAEPELTELGEEDLMGGGAPAGGGGDDVVDLALEEIEEIKSDDAQKGAQ
jgi:predicted component of type VI protein secretion system